MASLLRVRELPVSLVDALTQVSYMTRPSIRSFSQCQRSLATVGFDALNASKGDRERVVILGSGWAGYVLSQRLSAKFQTLVISPRSYFVFTPLLNSTAVGTLEFRTALEPVRSRRKPYVEFMQGWADDVDFDGKTVTVEESVVDQTQARALTRDRYEDHSTGEAETEKRGKKKEGKRWKVKYDKLIVTVGCYSQTFGTRGVKENAYFMKDIGDARRIRKRVLECFEIANLPTTSEKMREQLLRFAVVGGGPTGMEFAAELNDLVQEDLTKLYPALTPKVRISVLDVAPKVLSMFDEKLGKYAMETFRRENIDIKTSHHVEELRPGLPRNGEDDMEDISDSQGCYTLRTEEDGDIGVGMCVWSTGNMMNPFVQKALAKPQAFPSSSATLTDGKTPDQLASQNWMIEKTAKTGAIVVDDRLRVQLHSQATDPSSSSSTSTSTSEANNNNNNKTEAVPPPPASRATMTDVFALGDNASIRAANLPATAQTAAQQALWLAKRLNKNDLHRHHFTFRNLGIMTYLGNSKALVQTGAPVFGDLSGRAAWLVWRGAYLTMSVSWRNKVLIPTYWFLNWAFGRDITRF